MSITTVAPIVVVVALIGSFVVRNQIGDVALAVVFGLVGFLMIKFDASRVALIIAVVLAPIAEQNFHRALQISRGDAAILYARPLSLLLIILTVVVLLYPVYRTIRASG